MNQQFTANQFGSSNNKSVLAVKEPPAKTSACAHAPTGARGSLLWRRCRNPGASKWIMLVLAMLVASCGTIPLFIIPDPIASAGLDVNGKYRYRGAEPFFFLNGTITLEQDGDVVRVTETTYDSGSNRPLVGQGRLIGSTLPIVLVPENGDTDYQADVVFVFRDGGDTFAVSFSDTNDDTGGLGSFVAERVDD